MCVDVCLYFFSVLYLLLSLFFPSHVPPQTPVVDVVKDMAAQKYPTVIVVDGE